MPRMSALAAILFLFAACDPVDPYTVEGNVTDADGNGVGGVEILAGGTTQTATTDSTGQFSITLDDSPNLVVARKPGWEFLGVSSNQTHVQVEEPQGTPRTVTIAFGGGLDPHGRIAFSSDRHGGDPDIYIMDADGSNVTRLTTGGGTNPSLRPDSQMVVYQAHNQLAKVATSGGTPTVFADDCEEAQIEGGSSLRRIYENSQVGICFIMAPAYNQDGSRIAYWWDPTNSAIEAVGMPVLMVMDANGSNKEKVLVDDIKSRGKAWNMPPSWSPSDTLLAFTTWRRAGDGDVVLTDLDGNITTRFEDNSEEGNPSFVMGEDTVYINSDNKGDQNLFYFPTNTATIFLVPGGSGPEDTNPVISPHGALIAYVSDMDGDKEIYVTDRDGFGFMQLTNNTAEDDAPDWK